jgi:hypothetical protein
MLQIIVLHSDVRGPSSPSARLAAYCPVRFQLADEYATSARLYAEAVVLAASGTVGIESLRAITRPAYERSEVARVAFEEHVASHGC